MNHLVIVQLFNLDQRPDEPAVFLDRLSTRAPLATDLGQALLARVRENVAQFIGDGREEHVARVALDMLRVKVGR